MDKLIKTIFSITLLATLTHCENRDLNEGEAFKPREIHENIAFNFDLITVDGIEYLILEKDNNNPHEGFGFMALRGNKFMAKQDTVLAYLRTVAELQNKILASTQKKPIEDIRVETAHLLQRFLNDEGVELEKLESHRLKSDKTTTNVEE